MIIEGNANLVASIEYEDINDQYVEALTFNDGRVLALSANAMALYKNRGCLGDPLGNGLLHITSLPEEGQLKPSDSPWVSTHSAGFVGLSNGMALLILPREIRIYRNNQDALHNHNALASLPLSPNIQ